MKIRFAERVSVACTAAGYLALANPSESRLDSLGRGSKLDAIDVTSVIAGRRISRRCAQAFVLGIDRADPPVVPGARGTSVPATGFREDVGVDAHAVFMALANRG